MEDIKPREYRFVIQAWLPNTLYNPQEFGMDNLTAAIEVMKGVALDESFYRVIILDTQNMTEVGHLLNQQWLEGKVQQSQPRNSARKVEER